MMNLSKYVACICEGSAERAIIKLLLDENRLIFTWDKLLDGEILRCRNARKFEEQHLRKGFTGTITVLRLLDSRREKFKLSKAYASKIDVVNVITAPEIEMLVIFAEGQYDEYKKSKKKPSAFCKENLGMGDVKSTQFVESYFADIEILISAIREYRRVSNIQRGEYALADLLNPVGSAESSRPSDGFLFSPGVCQHDERPPLRWDEQKQGCEIVELSRSFSNY